MLAQKQVECVLGEPALHAGEQLSTWSTGQRSEGRLYLTRCQVVCVARTAVQQMRWQPHGSGDCIDPLQSSSRLKGG